MATALKIEEYGVSRLTCGGWPRYLDVGSTALKYALVFAALGALYLWRTQGADILVRRYDAVAFAFLIGFLLGIISQGGWREIELGEGGVSIRSSTRIETHPPEAIKELVVRPLRRGRVILETRWREEGRTPLVFCCRGIGTQVIDELSERYSIRYESGSA